MSASASATQGSARTDLSISMDKAGLYSLVFAVPLAVIEVGAYLWRWGGDLSRQGFRSLFGDLLVFLIVFFAGILLHELIHGLAWMLFGRKPFGAIKFGFQLETLTPYAHCTEPMDVNAYRIGAAMPGLLLGLLPAAIAILTGSGWLLAFGVLFSAAAGGDFLILWLIRNVETGKQVEDHPTRAGCYILDEETQAAGPA